MIKKLLQAVYAGTRWELATSKSSFMAQCAARDLSEMEHASKMGKKNSEGRRSKRRKRENSKASEIHDGDITSLIATAVSESSLVERPQRLVRFDVLDCNFGLGTLAGEILSAQPISRVVGMDCDFGVQKHVAAVERHFGSDRFRFFASKMSEALAMFGERSFDAVVIDPGPNFEQLETSGRGFDEDYFDLRYGPQMGTPALSLINSIDEDVFMRGLKMCSGLTPKFARRCYRQMCRLRPFVDSHHFFNFLEEAYNHDASELWVPTESSFGSRSSVGFMIMCALRAMVNNEPSELKAALHNSMAMLQPNGRVIVFTRLPFEENTVRDFIGSHPHALTAYSEILPQGEDVTRQEGTCTKMWVILRCRSAREASAVKNMVAIDDNDEQRYLYGLHFSGDRGFPANNFDFLAVSPEERAMQRKNRKPPPLNSI